jgi:hypothetical protein
VVEVKHGIMGNLLGSVPCLINMMHYWQKKWWEHVIFLFMSVWIWGNWFGVINRATYLENQRYTTCYLPSSFLYTFILNYHSGFIWGKSDIILCQKFNFNIDLKWKLSREEDNCGVEPFGEWPRNLSLKHLRKNSVYIINVYAARPWTARNL